MRRSLEDNLEAMRGPAMPAEVEARVRTRLRAAMAGHPKSKGITSRASYRQVALLIALMTAAGWVLKNQVAPVLRSAWERAHCWIDPGAKRP